MEGKVTFAVSQGPRRYQEDRMVVIPVAGADFKGKLLAVMDGHSGSGVAEFCANSIERIFKLSKLEHSESALRNLVSGLNDSTSHLESGSTFSAALVLDNPLKVSVAVLGDSPVVIYDKQGKLHISPEHNVRSNLAERKAAEGRGGIYENGYICTSRSVYGLQISRVLGDTLLAEVLSREPDVYTITDPVWVLVASDGVFDPSHSETDSLFKEVEQLAKENATAGDIMKWAEKRGLHDNATALVWCAD